MNPDELLDVEGAPDAQLREDLIALIRSAEANKPRSLQKALGPSEVGHPCERRLAYGTVASRKPDLPAVEKGLNRFNDPLAAIYGTAMHSWLEDAVRLANEALGRIRWIPEQRVEIRPAEFKTVHGKVPIVHEISGLILGWEWVDRQVETRPALSGTCDLYEVDTASVLDWKNLGSTSHKEFAKHGPGPVYRAQAHLYGAGYMQEFKLPVKKVGIVVLARHGGLRDTILWREDYNQALVDEVLARLDRVEAHIETHSLMTSPNGFAEVPITPSSSCSRTCPWYSPTPDGPYKCGAGKEES